MDDRERTLGQMGQRLSLARERAGLSQERASERARLSTTAISNYERGEVEPPVMSVKRLALAYGVSMDWILGMSEDMRPKDPEA